MAHVIYVVLNLAVEGAHCRGSRRACGRGTRCIYLHYCIGLCKPRNHNNANVREKRNADGLVEFAYSAPLKLMIEDLKLDIKHQRLEDWKIAEIFKAISEKVNEDYKDSCQSLEIQDVANYAKLASEDLKANIGMARSNFYAKTGDHLKQLGDKFENLDEEEFVCEVDENSPISRALNNQEIDFECPAINWNTEGRVGEKTTDDVRSWDDCSRFCYERTDCTYFSWYNENAGPLAYQCVTMEDAARKIADNNVISGSHHCGGEQHFFKST